MHSVRGVADVVVECSRSLSSCQRAAQQYQYANTRKGRSLLEIIRYKCKLVLRRLTTHPKHERWNESDTENQEDNIGHLPSIAAIGGKHAEK